MTRNLLRNFALWIYIGGSHGPSARVWLASVAMAGVAMTGPCANTVRGYQALILLNNRERNVFNLFQSAVT